MWNTKKHNQVRNTERRLSEQFGLRGSEEIHKTFNSSGGKKNSYSFDFMLFVWHKINLK